MKIAIRIALLISLFAIGAFAAEKANYSCCGNPCIPGLNCQK